MAFCTGSRSVLVASSLVGSLVAAYAVPMDSIRVVIEFFAWCVFFEFTRYFVAFDAVLDIIADLQAFNRLVVLIMMAFAAANFIIYVMFFMGKFNNGLFVLFIGLVFHFDHVANVCSGKGAGGSIHGGKTENCCKQQY